MNELIKISEVSKIINKKKIINNISLTIEKGKIYGFIGPNGAGKTTTIKLILGILPVSHGKISFNFDNINSKSDKFLSQIGVVMGPSYYGHLDVFKNMELIANIKGVSITKQRIQEYLDIVGLHDVSNLKVKKFSMGMKQRLSIAMSLIGDPQLLIWDEPINGLDPEGILEIRNLINKLNGEVGITFFISSHILNELDKVITDTIIIKHGEIIFYGSCDELLRKYVSQSLEEAYLNCLTGENYA